MKQREKRVDGFCVIYLHNPFECSKCIKVMESDKDNLEETFYTLYPERNKVSKLNSVHTDVPFSNQLLKTQKVSKDTNFLKPPRFTSTPLSSSKLSKRKKLSTVNSERSEHCNSFFEKTNKIKTPPKPSKKTSTEKLNTVKKQASKSVQKYSGDKIPGKGTLKRKRWFMEQLEQKNENYEDDLFEDQKFGHFRNLLEDESDNPENYKGLKTPVFPFSLSPREKTPSPDYTDCYNSEQLSISRKRGEEYQYRLKKKRKLDLPAGKKEAETPHAVQAGKSDSVLETLIQVEKMLSLHVSQEEISDTEDDQYFSDVLK